MIHFIRSKEMKISLTPAQAGMLSTKKDIKTIIRENPETVTAFDIYDDNDLIGFALIRRFEEKKYFLWEYAIDTAYQNQHKGTEALIAFIACLKERCDARLLTTTYIYGNEPAKRMYEKVGFVETEEIIEPDYHEVNMACSL